MIILLLAGHCFAGDDSGPAPAVTNQGKWVYEAKCAKCHRYYNPKSYDDTQWAAWMDKMRRKAHLAQEQYDQLSSYLQSVRHPVAQDGGRTNSPTPAR